MKRSLILLICLLIISSTTACRPAESIVNSATGLSSSSSSSQDEISVPEFSQNSDATGRISSPPDAFISVTEYPAVDGSTANLPMMAQVMSEVCKISLEQAQELTSCSGTSGAWSGLAYNNSDLLLVYEASETTKEYLEQAGTEFEITPIGRDGLVFIVNEDNPIDNLTTQNLIDIYTGKITRWSQLGGDDIEIVPYQRNEESGSQALFMKLLMRERIPMSPPAELKPGGMGGLIDGLASYNNSANAIGYSVFYYASYMYTQPGLKFISVNGVMPTDESIADGRYPFVNNFFVAIRENEPAGSPARRLRDWIISDAGWQAMITAGYIPIKG